MVARPVRRPLLHRHLRTKRLKPAPRLLKLALFHPEVNANRLRVSKTDMPGFAFGTSFYHQEELSNSVIPVRQSKPTHSHGSFEEGRPLQPC